MKTVSPGVATAPAGAANGRIARTDAPSPRAIDVDTTRSDERFMASPYDD